MDEKRLKNIFSIVLQKKNALHPFKECISWSLPSLKYTTDGVEGEENKNYI